MYNHVQLTDVALIKSFNIKLFNPHMASKFVQNGKNNLVVI